MSGFGDPGLNFTYLVVSLPEVGSAGPWTTSPCMPFGLKKFACFCALYLLLSRLRGKTDQHDRDKAPADFDEIRPISPRDS